MINLVCATLKCDKILTGKKCRKGPKMKYMKRGRKTRALQAEEGYGINSVTGKQQVYTVKMVVSCCQIIQLVT